MLPRSVHRGAARWVALGALMVLIAGLAVAMQQWRSAGAPSQPPRVAVEPDAASVAPVDEPAVDDVSMDDVAIEQALRLTPGLEGKEDKSGWMDEVKGVDLAELGPGRRELFLRHANAQRCTCGCGYTLARCRTYDPSCEVSMPRVRALFDSVRSGAIHSAVGLRSRPGAGVVLEPARR